MPVQSPSVRTIFEHALELPAGADRTAFLESACAADPELREQVEALLAAHAEAGSFLESPALTDAQYRTPDTLAEGPGTVIGPYKLLQQIGEGGMGVVFMAEQTAPLQRTVALKIIKPGMDTRQVIARFEAERQALAMMDHPNIAKVLDAGTTETGRPYFVMDLVKGVPITDYCDSQQLTVRQRLKLITQVCHAVQHAHQKGIIHRDLKPTNVLVAEYDNRAIPMVIDFGVAKATAQKLTERTMFTEFGQMVGTMEYMSPEQAKLNQLDIDTRSDIYSLGVLLYELLTGSTPFDRERLYSAAFDEMLRIIREEEPPPPSTKLSSSNTLPAVAAMRRTEPSRLRSDVRGELDWIVMKALEKDRYRRYATANGLAADIERHLNDEPVEAGPPSATYRFRKFFRRNKAAVLVTSVIAASLIAATAVSIWQAAIARDALQLAETRLKSETRARQEADSAREQAKNEAKRAAAEAEKATTSAQTAQAVIDFLNWDLLGRANYDQSRDTQNRADGGLSLRAALDRAAERLKGRFVDRPLAEASIRHMIGYTYSQLGDEFYAQAEPYLTRALELRRIHLGENHLETIRSLMVLAYVRRDVPLQRTAVAHSRLGIGDEHELTQWCKFHLALGLMWTGQNAEAISLFREVLAAKRKTLGSQHPDTAWLAHLLAVAEGTGGIDSVDDQEIESLYREALSVYLQSGPDWSWRTSDIALRFGQFLKSRGRLEEAAKTLQEAYLRLESMSANVEWALPLVYEIEAVYEEWGKPDQLAIWRQKKAVVGQNALARYAHLRRENPNDPGLVISYASLLAQLGRQQEAEAAYREAIELQPGNPRARHLLGDCLEKQGEYVAAEAEYREVMRLADDNPFYSDLHHQSLGIALLRQSKLVEAEAEFREAIRLRPNVAWYHHWLGDVLKEQNRWDEAEAAYRVAIGIDANNPGRYVNLADTMAAAGKSAEAAKELRTAVERHPTSAVWQRSFGHFLLHTMRDPEKALPVLEVAVRLDPDDRHAQYDFGNAYALIGQWENAIPAFRRRVDLEPDGEPEARYRLAALCLYAGDIDGYRAICRDMLARFGTSADPHFVDCTAKICLLVPDVDENRDRALVLADQNIKQTDKHRDHRWFVLAKGLADYRAGRFVEAVRRIEQFTPEAEGQHADATGFTVLAMARHRLGQGEQARSALLSARKILSSNMPNPEKARPFGDDWPDWLHSQILIREAEELIEIQSKENKRTKAAD